MTKPTRRATAPATAPAAEPPKKAAPQSDYARADRAKRLAKMLQQSQRNMRDDT